MPEAHRDPAFVAFHITAISEHVFIWLKCVIFWPAGRTDAVNNRKTVYRYFAPVDGVKEIRHIISLNRRRSSPLTRVKPRHRCQTVHIINPSESESVYSVLQLFP